jgi:uncharacterized protein YndB with AHSA1/START domain
MVDLLFPKQVRLRGSVLRAPFQFGKRAARETAEPARGGAKLLGVIGAPRLEGGEPAAEAGKLIRRQPGHGFGNLFDFHGAQYSIPAGTSQFSWRPKRRKTIVQITVETNVAAPIEEVWRAYTTPADIKQWNAASADWHTTAASVDLREGGKFSSRMEAKDGSMGFDFAGTYTKIVKPELIEYSFGDRKARVEFTPGPAGVRVRVTFDSESTHSIEQQRQGWQSILDNFARHVQARQKS